MTTDNRAMTEPSGTVCRHCGDEISAWVNAVGVNIWAHLPNDKNHDHVAEPAPAEQPRTLTMAEVKNLAGYNRGKYEKVSASPADGTYCFNCHAPIVWAHKEPAGNCTAIPAPAAQPFPDGAKVAREIADALCERVAKQRGIAYSEITDCISAILCPYFPQVSANSETEVMPPEPAIIRANPDNNRDAVTSASLKPSGLAGEATQGPRDNYLKAHAAFVADKVEKIGSAPAGPEGAAPPSHIFVNCATCKLPLPSCTCYPRPVATNEAIQACKGIPYKSLGAIHCKGCIEAQRAVGEVAELLAKADRVRFWLHKHVADVLPPDDIGKISAAIEGQYRTYKKRSEAAEAQLHDAFGFILALNEETVLAGFPGGDRNQTLANVRAMKAQLRTAHEALQRIQARFSDVCGAAGSLKADANDEYEKAWNALENEIEAALSSPQSSGKGEDGKA